MMASPAVWLPPMTAQVAFMLLPIWASSLSLAPDAQQPSRQQVQDFVAQLIRQARANVTAEAEYLEASTSARLEAVLQKQMDALGGASAREKKTLLNNARKQFEDMRKHEEGLEDAVQYASLKTGIEAARDAIGPEIQRRLSGKHLTASSQQILGALRGTERRWKEARDASQKAAAQAFNEWNSSINGVNATYTSIVSGFEHLNDAGEAVTRAGRAIHWDEAASRFASSLAESTYANAIEAASDVQLAEEQSDEAQRLTRWFASGAEAKLENAVKSAEEEASAAAQD